MAWKRMRNDSQNWNLWLWAQPVTVAKVFVQLAVSVLRYYAGLTDKTPGETYPDDGSGVWRMVVHEPIGVCAGISAWNGTFLLFAWKIGPAIAAGNTYIFKASEKSPLGALALGDLVKKANFPPGVINILAGGPKTGSYLASHMHIAKISFTGSAAAGRQVQVAAANSNLKRCTLELGGKSPSLVFDDADIPSAVAHNSEGFLLNSGQICIASSRVFVQEGVASEFIAAMKAAYVKFSGDAMGDPTLDSTYLGPLADKKQFDRVMAFLTEGRKEGLEVIAGGGRKGDKGTFVEPTILLNPSLDSRLYKEEIFGPVVAIKTFKDEAEVLRMANDTTYGLGATIYTSDLTRALRVASAVEAGVVSINSSHTLPPQTPFGGFKQSGYGRESGLEGIKAFLNVKTINISMAVRPVEAKE